MNSAMRPKHFLPGEGKTFKLGPGSATSKASDEAKAIASKYGLEFLNA